MPGPDVGAAPAAGIDRDALVLDNRKLAFELAHQAWLKAQDERHDDFEAAALLGLVEASRAFDPGRDVLFGTFAYWRIRGALSEQLRFHYRGKAGGPSRETSSLDALPRAEAAAILAREGPGDDDALEHVEALLARLPGRGRFVVRHSFGIGVRPSTLGQVAAACGLTRQWAGQVRIQMLRQLRGFANV